MQSEGTIRIVTRICAQMARCISEAERPLNNDAAAHHKAMGLVVSHPIDILRILIESFGHHEGDLYDFDALAAELIRAGFKSSSVRAWQQR
jgi:hypothetical protein